jgi:hypothetical protein
MCPFTRYSPPLFSLAPRKHLYTFDHAIKQKEKEKITIKGGESDISTNAKKNQ